MNETSLVGRKVRINHSSPIYPGVIARIYSTSIDGDHVDCLVGINRPGTLPLFRTYNLNHITVLPKE